MCGLVTLGEHHSPPLTAAPPPGPSLPTLPSACLVSLLAVLLRPAGRDRTDWALTAIAWQLCWAWQHTRPGLSSPDHMQGGHRTLSSSLLSGWQGGRTGESYNGMFLLQAAGDCRRTACNAAELSPPAAASCRRTAVKARQGLSLLQSVRLPGALIFLLGTGNTSLSLPLSLSLLTLYSLLSLSYYQYNTKSSIPKYFLHAVLCLYCVGSMM